MNPEQRLVAVRTEHDEARQAQHGQRSMRRQIITTANQLSRRADPEERRENGLGLIMIGFMLWFFDALVFFFMPAGARLGHQRPFEILIGCAFVAGALLISIGTRLRK
jgi:hypothetical protein